MAQAGRHGREPFKKKLAERLETPRVPADALHGLEGHYKIKLRASGYRLVYRVEDTAVIVNAVAIGKRERSEVYRVAASRGGVRD